MAAAGFALRSRRACQATRAPAAGSPERGGGEAGAGSRAAERSTQRLRSSLAPGPGISNVRPVPLPAVRSSSKPRAAVPRVSGCGASPAWFAGRPLPERLAPLVDLEIRALQVLHDPLLQLSAAVVRRMLAQDRAHHLLAAKAVLWGQAIPRLRSGAPSGQLDVHDDFGDIC
jgi:hypothetical protein